MKKVLWLLVMVLSFSLANAQGNALLDINFGMTKKEIKEIVNKDKESKGNYAYLNLGEYDWRYHYQTNCYDKNGGVTILRLFPIGSGLYGTSEQCARLIFKSTIQMLIYKGFAVPNDIEFKINETYVFTNKEMGKTFIIGLPPLSKKVCINIAIERYSDEVKDYSKVVL